MNDELFGRICMGTHGCLSINLRSWWVYWHKGARRESTQACMNCMFFVLGVYNISLCLQFEDQCEKRWVWDGVWKGVEDNTYLYLYIL